MNKFFIFCLFQVILSFVNISYALSKYEVMSSDSFRFELKNNLLIRSNDSSLERIKFIAQEAFLNVCRKVRGEITKSSFIFQCKKQHAKECMVVAGLDCKVPFKIRTSYFRRVCYPNDEFCVGNDIRLQWASLTSAKSVCDGLNLEFVSIENSKLEFINPDAYLNPDIEQIVESRNIFGCVK